MPDDKTKIGSPDSKRINVHEPYELKRWANQFGVSPDALKQAVQKVGNSVQKVKDHLGK